MGIFDSWKKMGADAERRMAENRSKTEADSGAKLVLHFLTMDAQGGDHQIILTSLKHSQNMVRAALRQWDRLASENPKEFNQERKQRISELLDDATKND